MKLSKFTAGIVSVLTISATAVSVITANGAENTVNITVGNETVKAGSEFTLDVSVSNIPETGVQGFDFAVKYDDTLVSVDSVEAGPLVQTGAEEVDGSIDIVPIFDANIASESSSVYAYFGTASADPAYWMHGDGVVFTITGTVLENAADGSVAEFDIVPIPRPSNDDGNEINDRIWMGYYSDVNSDEGTMVFYDIETISGSVIVESEGLEFIKGDANCDGVVAVADAVAVAANVSDSEKNFISEQGRINADVHMTGNDLNASDALMIQQYATGIITEF